MQEFGKCCHSGIIAYFSCLSHTLCCLFLLIGRHHWFAASSGFPNTYSALGSLKDNKRTFLLLYLSFFPRGCFVYSLNSLLNPSSPVSNAPTIVWYTILLGNFSKKDKRANNSCSKVPRSFICSEILYYTSNPWLMIVRLATIQSSDGAPQRVTYNLQPSSNGHLPSPAWLCDHVLVIWQQVHICSNLQCPMVIWPQFTTFCWKLVFTTSFWQKQPTVNNWFA